MYGGQAELDLTAGAHQSQDKVEANAAWIAEANDAKRSPSDDEAGTYSARVAEERSGLFVASCKSGRFEDVARSGEAEARLNI